MSAFPDADLSVTMPPATGLPTTDQTSASPSRRSFSGVEVGVITVALAIAVVTLCFMLSVATAKKY